MRRNAASALELMYFRTRDGDRDVLPSNLRRTHARCHAGWTGSRLAQFYYVNEWRRTGYNSTKCICVEWMWHTHTIDQPWPPIGWRGERNNIKHRMWSGCMGLWCFCVDWPINMSLLLLLTPAKQAKRANTISATLTRSTAAECKDNDCTGCSWQQWSEHTRTPSTIEFVPLIIATLNRVICACNCRLIIQCLCCFCGRVVINLSYLRIPWYHMCLTCSAHTHTLRLNAQACANTWRGCANKKW